MYPAGLVTLAIVKVESVKLYDCSVLLSTSAYVPAGKLTVMLTPSGAVAVTLAFLLAFTDMELLLNFVRVGIAL